MIRVICSLILFISSVIHGGWGNWDNVGNCSRTCGRGVRTRSRKCDNPLPQHGGSHCSGASYESEICNENDWVKKSIISSSQLNASLFKILSTKLTSKIPEIFNKHNDRELITMLQKSESRKATILVMKTKGRVGLTLNL